MRAAAAAVLCSATLLLTAILPTHALNTTTAPSSSSAAAACDPVTCGGLRIAYPFWLGGTHPPECGYRAFQVSCDANGTVDTATLHNSFWMYHILDISYDDSSFTVANAYLSDDGACDFQRLQVNASLDLGLAPFTISKANQELFLYNCTTALPSRTPPAWAPVTCADDGLVGSNASKSFAWLAGSYRPDDEWKPVPGNCTISMMPVLGYDGAAGKDYRRLMKGGFLLNYTAGDCDACVHSGGLCRINTTLDIFECHCAHGVSELIICHGN